MSKIKNGGLDQYGAEPFEQQQFGTGGVEGVNMSRLSGLHEEYMQLHAISGNGAYVLKKDGEIGRFFNFPHSSTRRLSVHQ